MQNILNITIINYKYLSKTYIIYESNGIVKEYIYDKDILLFEGTYLNGKRSGKGKNIMMMVI